MIFRYETTVRPEWIDYNGHMQDAYYGLIFSYAVDALQDEVGFDEEYRRRSGCTIYLIEDHKFYLSEVFEGDCLSVQTRVLDVDEKRFHLHLMMSRHDTTVAVCEFIEIHVRQNPSPNVCAMPEEIRSRLEKAAATDDDYLKSTKRSRALSIRHGI